jgi:hemolysin III
VEAEARAITFEQAVADERPLLRGWFHAWAAAAAILGAAVLLLIADSPAAYVGGAVFAASLVALYATSASYHRIMWGPTARSILKRLDHSMIFVLIAGTYTPIALKVGGAWGISILCVAWGIAGGGILMKLAWPHAPRWLSVSMYVGLGWMSLVAAEVLITSFPPGPIIMLALGGVLYTVGGVVYALRRPDPWPRIFGYHEVFHLLVVAGSVVHFTLIAAFVV